MDQTPDETAKQTLLAIARGYRTTPAGYHSKLWREDCVNAAREACVKNGWDFSYTKKDRP